MVSYFGNAGAATEIIAAAGWIAALFLFSLVTTNHAAAIVINEAKMIKRMIFPALTGDGRDIRF
ncbi:MAG: hypothetical protein Q7W05_11915 [Deltaproteobacteria bacterium]|nr:hypothetical protein [Deltaproteobacteria bacterium]